MHISVVVLLTLCSFLEGTVLNIDVEHRHLQDNVGLNSSLNASQNNSQPTVISPKITEEVLLSVQEQLRFNEARSKVM